MDGNLPRRFRQKAVDRVADRQFRTLASVKMVAGRRPAGSVGGTRPMRPTPRKSWPVAYGDDKLEIGSNAEYLPGDRQPQVDREKRGVPVSPPPAPSRR